MAEDRDQRFRAERSRQLQRLPRIQRDTAAEIARLLRQAQRIQAALAAQPSDFSRWRLTALRAQVRQALAEADAACGRSLSQGARDAWSAGGDLLDTPLAAAGVTIAAHLPIIDPRQLTAMQSFMTDRMTDITVGTADRINAQLGLTIAGVQTPAEAVTNIARLIEGGRERALTIIRTEIGRAYSTATQLRQVQAVQLLPGLQKQWRRSGKIHSRPVHDAINGQIRDVDRPFDVDGFKLMYPRDSAGPPAETINCGCQNMPYMASWHVATPSGSRGYGACEISCIHLRGANSRRCSSAFHPWARRSKRRI
jgi:hypothetical protein